LLLGLLKKNLVREREREREEKRITVFAAPQEDFFFIIHHPCNNLLCVLTLELVRDSDWLQVGRSGDQIAVGVEIFHTRPDRPWGPSSLLYGG